MVVVVVVAAGGGAAPSRAESLASGTSEYVCHFRKARHVSRLDCEDTMLTMTEAAGAHLARKLAERRASAGKAIRIVRKRTGDGWTMRVDKMGKDDVTFTHAGKTVLALNEKASRMLEDKTLDVKKTSAGPRLSLR